MDKDKIQQQLQHAKIRQGSVLKRSRFLKEWRERWLVLTSNYLITFTNKTCKQVTDVMDIRTIKSYKSYVSKSEQMIPAGFKMRSGDTAFYLCMKSVQQKWSWLVSIERLIDYKQSGPTAYNNLTSIKTKGFPSQQQYNNHLQPNVQSTMIEQIKTAEKKKQDLEKQSIQIAQKIFKQKQQIQKERNKLKQQYKQLYCLRQTIQKTQQARTSFQQKQKPELVSSSHPSKKIESVSSGSTKNAIITGIFDQFIAESDQFFGFKYYVDFMINVCSDTRLCFQKQFINNCKQHPNNRIFGKILVQFLWQYEPTTFSQSGDNRSSSQMYSIALLSKQMQYFENWMKFINILLKNQVNIFTKDHHQKIARKLKNFLLHDESDSTEEVKTILDAITKMNKVIKFQKSEISSRLQKIIKLSKKQEISQLAKNLLAQL